MPRYLVEMSEELATILKNSGQINVVREDSDLSPDGRGLYIVHYVYPDNRNIGSDRFETQEKADEFAKSLRKKGYRDVNISVDQRGSF